jgi:hypothetical protein
LACFSKIHIEIRKRVDALLHACVSTHWCGIFVSFSQPGLIKAAWGGLLIQEGEMRLITRFELAAKSKEELHALLRKIFNKVANGKLSDQERDNALASMQNIQNELVYRFQP